MTTASQNSVPQKTGSSTQQVPAQDYYVLFCGPIDQSTVPKIANSLAVAVQRQMGKLHLAIQSTGGTVGDAIFLHNILKSLPLEVVTYNCGQVSSAAVIVYLAGKTRVVSKNAMFMIHRSYLNTQGSKGRMRNTADYLAQEDERTDAIYNEHVKLPAELEKELEHRDLFFTTEDALKFTFATQVGEFRPSLGPNFVSVVI